MPTQTPRRVAGQGPGSKIVRVNDKLGITGIGNMQATTRIIYDSLLLQASAVPTTMTFFQNVATRQFPFTNLQENKFQVGESMSIERLSLYLMVCSTGTATVRSTDNISFFQQFQQLYASQFNFKISEQTIVKDLPLTAMYAPFNKDARFCGSFATQPLAADPTTYYQIPHDVFKFDNDNIIPQQVQFTAPVLIPPIPAIVAGVDVYLVCKISGLGSLFAPKGRY